MPDHENSVDMTYEEAKKVLEDDSDKRAVKQLVDDVYPWWVTFRRPFMILSAVIGVLCIAIIFLSFTLKSISTELNRANDEDECYSRFTNASTEAIGRVRSASTNIDVSGWEALVSFVEDGHIEPSDVAGIREQAAVAREALFIDQVKIQERTQWVADGRPLPCPIPEDTTTEITTVSDEDS